MEFQTKYSEGDKVWLINPKSAVAALRTICGVRTQSLFGDKKTIYCFVKDWKLSKTEISLDDCFWVSENKFFASKKELQNSI